MKRLAAAATGAALLSSVVLSGCAAFTDDSASSADGVEVAAAFYPLQYVADRVAGDHAKVENLTSPGNEPHDLELSPKETADVARADLVLYQRGFQPSVDDAVDQSATGDTLDVTDVVDLVPFRDHGVDSRRARPALLAGPAAARRRRRRGGRASREGRPGPTPTTTRPTLRTCVPTSSSSTGSTPTG